MKENYESSLAHVLKSEGLWSDNPLDSGGATMKGITLAVFKEWKRNQYLTKDDLKNISDQDVIWTCLSSSSRVVAEISDIKRTEQFKSAVCRASQLCQPFSFSHCFS